MAAIRGDRVVGLLAPTGSFDGGFADAAMGAVLRTFLSLVGFVTVVGFGTVLLYAFL